MNSDTRKRVLPALLVSVIWGVNFSAIAQANEDFPPLLLAALRFTLCVIPAIFFVKRPAVKAGYIVAYGLLFGLLQFAFLFQGYAAGIGAGPAAFLLQSQVFFTVLLALLVLGERLSSHQSWGLLLGFGGIALIAVGRSENVTLVGASLVVAAGAAWGAANLIVKVARPGNSFAFLVYASAVPVVPFYALSLYFEGGNTMLAAVATADWTAWASLFYLAYPTTLLGYAIWNQLLRTHPAVRVAPFALLIPVVGVIAAAIWRNETLSPTHLVGFAAILGGISICQYWPNIRARLYATIGG